MSKGVNILEFQAWFPEVNAFQDYLPNIKLEVRHLICYLDEYTQRFNRHKLDGYNI